MLIVAEMDFLRSAVAYRADFKSREVWANSRAETIAVGCPSGCTVEYDLIVAEQATESDVNGWVDTLHSRMERQHPNHDDTIFFL